MTPETSRLAITYSGFTQHTFRFWIRRMSMNLPCVTDSDVNHCAEEEKSGHFS